jgi:lipooligosaccharide transport system permease protein
MTAPAIRYFESRARIYRHTWRASAVSTFLNPVLYLTAMGLGLGTLVDRGAGTATLDGMTYLMFLAPGLLAATAMQTAAGDAAYPVMAGIKWIRTYEATLASPLGVRDLVMGHLAWVAARLTLTSVAFVVVMALFGAVSLGAGLLAIGPAVLTGMAFAGAITAFTARLEDPQGLAAMFRFGIVPMFLFSGTFFPVAELPGWMHPIAYATPLWHGVELTRRIALGLETTISPALQTGYLLVWALVGGWLAVRFLRKRMIA